VLARYNNNAAGWTFRNATSADVFANHSWDSTVVAK
jgi:hypothetical protein